MEESLPDDVNSCCSAGVLEDKFGKLDIGSETKTVMEKYCAKKDEISLEDDNIFQEGRTSEQWNSLDGMSYDDASEWGRSNSSSMSWFDESEQEATLKVKNMMDNMERMLYGELHMPLPKPVLEECQQWKLRFPHLRVVGTATNISYPEVEEIESYLETGLQIASEGNPNKLSDQTVGKCPEEAKEEVYACHGTIENEPVISHKFQNQQKPVENHNSKIIKEALLNELAMHVWKEAVLPGLQSFIEKYSRPNEDQPHQLAEKAMEEVNKLHFDGSQMSHRKQTSAASPLYSQPKMPLSARQSSSSATESYFNEEDPFECYRRHSDQPFLNSKKYERMLAPSKISEEEGEYEEHVTGTLKIDKNVSELRRRRFFHGRTVVNNKEEILPEEVTAKGSRFHSISPRRSGVVKELRPLERSRVSADLNSRLKGKSDRFKHRERPHSKPKTLKLPAIEDSKCLAKNESCSAFYGRSSSALPRLTPKNFRPTSMYKNMQGEISSASQDDNDLTSKHEIGLLRDRLTVSHKKFDPVQSTSSSTERNKREKQRNSRYYQPQS